LREKRKRNGKGIFYGGTKRKRSGNKKGEKKPLRDILNRKPGGGGKAHFQGGS